jgi:hypothetical protein
MNTSISVLQPNHIADVTEPKTESTVSTLFEERLVDEPDISLAQYVLFLYPVLSRLMGQMHESGRNYLAHPQ